MSTTRHHRLTYRRRSAAKRSRAADEALSRLIADATPARVYDRELRGEAEAVAAFREARLGAAAAAQRRSGRPQGTGRLLALGAAIAAVGLSGGGVALAAATGHLPAPLTGNPAPPARTTPSASGSPSASGGAAHAKGGTPSTASTSPVLHSLCRSYDADAKRNPGTALNDPAYTPLVTAAGSKGKVRSYCASLLASSPQGHPSHSEGQHSGHSMGNPGNHGRSAADHGRGSAGQPGGNGRWAGNQSGHPGGKPTTQPTTPATGGSPTASTDGSPTAPEASYGTGSPAPGPSTPAGSPSPSP